MFSHTLDTINSRGQIMNNNELKSLQFLEIKVVVVGGDNGGRVDAMVVWMMMMVRKLLVREGRADCGGIEVKLSK